ncbi:MAG: hypothetical protein SOI38_05525 [Eggerthellaceae bacterium]
MSRRTLNSSGSTSAENSTRPGRPGTVAVSGATTCATGSMISALT